MSTLMDPLKTGEMLHVRAGESAQSYTSAVADQLRAMHEDGSATSSPPASPTSFPPPRVVLHIDLDAFFVQVERSLNPTLIGKPMCVFQHADVIAVSYEARKLGVTKHMPTPTIRREYPSVKLVHVQTIGLQNDKVSYRNYRAAARAIFTLIQAFCSAEEEETNGTASRGGAGGAKHQNASGAKARGKFQKTSVDEAYLEPSRRTLMTELLLSSDREKNKPGAGVERSVGPERAPMAGELLRAGVKRPRSADTCVSGNVPFSASVSEQACRDDDGGGCAPTLYRQGEETVENQRGLYTPEGDDGDVEAGYDSIEHDGHQNGCARQGRRDGNGRTEKVEEEEEAQLLKAGGLLGRRIQQTVRDVLKYDCSVGVAGNKFLAKLAANLAKPKGVCVLPRRDVSAVLAATPATKIPGCGAGSATAKQFAALGARTILDLRRIEAPEMRQRLGEQQGTKVFDRCRGIDNDPVEPNPIPSRVSSQLALVPLISPAHCLGKPGEKLTPVFPWEVERVKPFLVTLVDDLMDRMKEELAERHRRPTKLCIEHHLFQRGSKSQTFALPARGAQLPRPRTVQISSATEGFGDRHERSERTLAPTSVVEEETADSVSLLGLPPASSLVELALTPFKNYRNSSKAKAVSDGTEVQKRRTAEEGRAGMNRRGEHLPPVVKLIVTFLGFESVGPAPPTAAPPGQQTLRGMMWLKKDDALSGTPAAMKEAPKNASGRSAQTSPQPPRRVVPEGLSAAEIVAPSPGPDLVPIRSPMKCGVVHAQDVASPTDKGGCEVAGGVENLPTRAAEEGSVLVRCPSCKACLPVGKAWDTHREEHISGAVANGRTEQKDYLPSRTPAAPQRTGALLQPLLSEVDAKSCRLPVDDRNAHVRLEPRPRLASSEVEHGATAGEQEEFVEGSSRKLGGGYGSEENASSPRAVVRSPARDTTAESGRCPDDRARSRKLSDLLMLAISPEQAADVLRQRGFLAADGQTRFGNFNMLEGQRQLE